MAISNPDHADLDAVAIDVAANQLLLTSLMRAIAEKTPDTYARAIACAHTEMAARRMDNLVGGSHRSLTDAVCAVVGAVDRHISGERSIATK